MRQPNELSLYLNEIFHPQGNPTVDAIQNKLKDDNKSGINISSHEASILQFFIRTYSIQSIVEIGTLYGYSTYLMAQALPAQGKIFSIEKDPQNHHIATTLLKQSDQAEKITLLNGDAIEVLEDISKMGPFDMVFIDANKGGYENYLDWAEKNTHRGGLIVGDNTFLFGHVYGKGQEHMKVSQNVVLTMQNFNKRLTDPKKYYSMIIPTDEGMTVSVVK